jgi:hypothetical protein
MKNIEFTNQLRKLQKETQNTNWQKAIFWTLLISLAVFIGAMAYLYLRPTPTSITTAIDTEVESQQINFNFPTLEKLKNRQVPAANSQAPSGKNPFTPF